MLYDLQPLQYIVTIKGPMRVEDFINPTAEPLVIFESPHRDELNALGLGLLQYIFDTGIKTILDRHKKPPVE